MPISYRLWNLNIISFAHAIQIIQLIKYKYQSYPESRKINVHIFPSSTSKSVKHYADILSWGMHRSKSDESKNSLE